jgi:hypothetical protein
MKTPLTAAAIAFAISSSAAAQPMAQVCNVIPCIRDANNKIVGIPLLYFVSRQIKEDWYAIQVTQDGLPAEGTYYYAGPNCTRQAYIYDQGHMPQIALYDGGAVFAADRRGGDGFDWQSYSFPAKVNRGGTCTNYGSDCIGQGKPCHAEFGGPAIKLETVTFSGDLKIR